MLKTHLLFVSAACAVLALTIFAEITETATPSRFLISGVNYDSLNANPTISTPKLINADVVGVVGYDIHFKVNAHGDQYDNFFQTSDGSKAIRLELTHPRTLNVVFSDISEHYYKVTERFDLNRWHDIRLVAKKGKFVEVFLDDNKILTATEKSIELLRDGEIITLVQDQWSTAIKSDFGMVAVGSGFSRTRNLRGEIRDFSMTVDHIKRWSPANILALILSLGLMAVFYWYLFRHLSNQRLVKSFLKTQSGLAFLGIVLVAATVGWLISLAAPSYAKWIPLVVVGLTMLLLPVIERCDHFTSTMHGRSLSITMQLIGMGGLIFLLVTVGIAIRPSLSPGMLFFILASGITTVTLAMCSTVTTGRAQQAVQMSTLGALFFASWASLVELPNWIGLNASMHQQTSITVILAILSLAICWKYIFWEASAPTVGNWIVRNKYLSSIIGFLVYGIFALLSFRYDSLFLGSSELHWEYYVGPIRSLREGSWLLWDTPSQYGFLNTLIPSTFPTTNSWQALYLFQGMLLLIASSLAYRAMVITSPTNKLFAFILVVTGVFFADPDLIGPSLYPSSSVMRFFWCYVLLFLLANFVAKRGSELRSLVLPGLGAWLAGVFWSFESAVYCTAIYFSAMAATSFSFDGLGKRGFIKGMKIFSFRCTMAMFSLAALVFSLWSYYQGNLQASPDWSMFYEHALFYGGGFGGVPISAHGAGWVYIMIFVGIASTIFRTDTRTVDSQRTVALQAGAMGCVLAITTYYIGRAYASNITAVLPIIALALALCLKAGNGQHGTPRLLLAVVAVPLFVVLLAGSLGSTEFLQKMLNIKTMTAHVEQQLRMPDPALEKLMAQAGITPNDPVVYYGFAATMPAYVGQDGNRLVFDKSWLPTPLQLMEEPIGSERRRVTIARFAARIPNSGFIVKAKGQNEDRANEWMLILGVTHRIDNVYENKDYKIIRFESLSATVNQEYTESAN